MVFTYHNQQKYSINVTDIYNTEVGVISFLMCYCFHNLIVDKIKQT